MIDTSSVLGDRKKVWSILSLLILCALTFVLLFKYDFGNFCKIKSAIAENKYNKATLDSLGEYKKYLEEFNACLATGNGIDWLMGTIAVVSKSNGVTLSAMKPFETERSSGYSIVKVSVEGVSSYENFLRLIEALEDNREYTFIDSISVGSIEVGADGAAKNPSAVLEGNAPRGGSIAFKAIIASVLREI